MENKEIEDLVEEYTFTDKEGNTIKTYRIKGEERDIIGPKNGLISFLKSFTDEDDDKS